jgi:branched-chain amino acid aminotransferase
MKKMIAEDTDIKVEKIAQSRISQVDFDNIKFGKEFSDHMFVMDYIDGEWQDMRIMPFQNLTLNPAVSVIHYGQSIFEGMKAYRNESDDVYLFRPEMNIKRFNVSAERLCMPQVPENVFEEALVKLLDMDREWIPQSDSASLYIRPFMFATDEYIGVRPSESYRFMIFTCPVGSYYSGAVKVKVERHYTRSTPGGTGFAKAAGNYAGALYPAQQAKAKGYDQLIWTDAIEHKYIEESGTMNIVFKSGNKILSPKPSETILAGITRDSVMQLAKDWGYDVEERRISLDELREMLEKGELDEAFGAGTAATIAPIKTIGFEDQDFDLSSYDKWEFAPRAFKELEALKRGNGEDVHQWNMKF